MVRSVRRLERVLPIWDESILLMTLYTCGIALHAASMRSCSSGAAAVGAVGSASVNIDILCLRMCVCVCANVSHSRMAGDASDRRTEVVAYVPSVRWRLWFLLVGWRLTLFTFLQNYATSFKLSECTNAQYFATITHGAHGCMRHTHARTHF